MIYKCFYKSVSEGEGIEAEQFRKQNDRVNFDYCKNYCCGFDIHGTCNNYTPDLTKKIINLNNEFFDRLKYEHLEELTYGN